MNLQNREDYGESNTPASNELTVYIHRHVITKRMSKIMRIDNDDDDDDE